jgi:hypothetical protein
MLCPSFSFCITDRASFCWFLQAGETNSYWGSRDCRATLLLSNCTELLIWHFCNISSLLRMIFLLLYRVKVDMCFE